MRRWGAVSTPVAHASVDERLYVTPCDCARVSYIVGQQPEGAVVCEGPDGAEVSPIQRQHRVGVELSRKGHVHSIGKVEPQVEVASAHCLGNIEDVGRHLRKYGTTRPHPAADVVDRLVRCVTAQDPAGYMIKLAEQHWRNDQRSGVAQHGARGFPVRMSLIEGGYQSGRVCHDDQEVGLLVRS